MSALALKPTNVSPVMSINPPMSSSRVSPMLIGPVTASVAPGATLVTPVPFIVPPEYVNVPPVIASVPAPPSVPVVSRAPLAETVAPAGIVVLVAERTTPSSSLAPSPSV